MKNRIILRLAFVLAAVGLFASCETDMEKAQAEYSAAQVIPSVLGVTGSTLALQTFSYNYTLNYYRAGSTWAWSATDATISAVSADTRTATVLYTTVPASDTALIKVIETTEGGTASAQKVVKVRVNPFCPLTNGVADLVGSWDGDDAYYPSVVTTVKTGANLVSHSFGVGFIEDWWAEAVSSVGDVIITVNPDGTLDIARQHVFTTLYSGHYYDYDILGSGTWDNCGASPSMLITYDIYYEGDAVGLAATYAAYLDGIPYLTADIELGSKKSAAQATTNNLIKPSFKK